VITIIEGKSFEQAEVATLVMAKLAHRQFEVGKKVISNAELKFNHEKIDNKKLMEIFDDDRLNEYVLALDRAYLFIDSRMTQSSLNKLISYAAHGGLDMVLTTSTIDFVDKRLRKACTYRIHCSRIRDGQAAVYVLNLDEGTRFRKWLPINEFRELCDVDKISPYLDSDKLLSSALELTDKDKVVPEEYDEGINQIKEESENVLV